MRVTHGVIVQEEQMKAFCRLTAVTRGFLTRRLLQTDKITQLRKTIQVHTHTHAHTHTHTHIHTLSHTHSHTHARTRTHTRTHACSHTHTLSLTHTHTLIHSHTHTHTHTRLFFGLRGLSIGVMVFILYNLYVLLPYTYPTPKLSPHRRLCAFFNFQKNTI